MMFVRRLCVYLFMAGRQIGMLLAMIWHEIYTDIINYAKNIINNIDILCICTIYTV